MQAVSQIFWKIIVWMTEKKTCTSLLKDREHTQVTFSLQYFTSLIYVIIFRNFSLADGNLL